MSFSRSTSYQKILVRFFISCILFFFLLMLILPTTFQMQRGILLCPLVLGGVISSIWNWACNKEILYIWLITVLCGSLFVLEGIINNAPGAIRVSTVYIIWPCIYILFVGLVRQPYIIKWFEKTLLLGILVSCLMCFLLIMAILAGYETEITAFLSFQGAGVGIYDGYIELTTYNLSTAIYGLPFLVALLLAQQKDNKIISQKITLLLLLLDFIICLFSGRRAFWLLALITPLIVYPLFFFAGIRIKQRYLIVAGAIVFVLILAGTYFLNIDIFKIRNQLLSAFDFSGEASASIRYEQFVDLFQHWLEYPIIGHGLGSSTYFIIRSEKMPWAYELSYMALLFHIGLLGFLIYAFAIFWIFYAGIKLVRYQPKSSIIILPLLSGLAGFLFVNATNPYLGKFDYLWTIFLPVAAINAYRKNNAVH